MSTDSSIAQKQLEPASRVRLTLELSARLNEAVERLAFSKGISKADVMRNALEFLEKANEAMEDGMHVGAWIESKDGVRREREFVGI
jgi:Arc/MetJ-type ribon-helix-helix transcriptional regulator